MSVAGYTVATAATAAAPTIVSFGLCQLCAQAFLALEGDVGQFGAWPTLTGFSTELFPTSHRALASSAAGIARVAGTCISFVLAALLIGLTGSLARSVALLAAGPLLALVIVAAGLPETAGRELEQTSAEFDSAPLPGPIPAADPVAQRDTAT